MPDSPDSDRYVAYSVTWIDLPDGFGPEPDAGALTGDAAAAALTAWALTRGTPGE